MIAEDKNIENTIKRVFGDQSLDLRSLQSIAFYLDIAVDADKPSRHELLTQVGRFLHANPMIEFAQQPMLLHISRKPKIDTTIFDFLHEEYGTSVMTWKINEYSIFDFQITESVFHRQCSRKILFGSLSDASKFSIDEISSKLISLKTNLESMRNFRKKFEWFDSDEKISSARDYFKKHYPPGCQPENKNDLELFFYSNIETADRKEVVFKKISALYNNRKSRDNTSKKQCNFAIDEKTIEFIKAIAQNSKISRSDLLEIIFHPKNKSILANLIKP